jgi:hypothetical protein
MSLRLAPFAGMNRIRFDGCDLSPARTQGTPAAATLAKKLVTARYLALSGLAASYRIA